MTLDERLSEAQLKLRNGYDDDLSRAIAEVRNQHRDLLALLRRIIVRDALNDNQWFWLHDCKELLEQIDGPRFVQKDNGGSLEFLDAGCGRCGDVNCFGGCELQSEVG